MTDIRVAREFFEEHLPETIHSLVELDTLKISQKSYIDENLNELSSDILYSVKIKNSDELAFIYVLAEHQSTVDPLMAFRLWNYIMLIIQDYIKQTSPKPTKLPLVFPLVFYHGKEPYNACRNLRDLIQAPADIVENVLFRDFCLVDTHNIKDEELRERHWASILVYMMKHVYDREVWSLIQNLIEMIKKIELEEGAVILITNLLEYWLIKAETTKQPQEFIETIQQGLSVPIKGALMNMGEQLIQQGVQKGIQQGIQLGEGALLIHLLEQKFTTLPKLYRQRVEQANTEMLLKWGVRVLEAKALEDVFN
jgi:predicted transposase/invertase (TIGR01784 family)